MFRLQRFIAVGFCVSWQVIQQANSIPNPCSSFAGIDKSLYHPTKDHCYYLFKDYRPYSEAKSRCSNYNLDMLELDSSEEWTWYCSVTSCYTQSWLGIKRKFGVWKWRASGKTIPAGDPRFVVSSGSYAYIQSSTKWARNNGLGSYKIVCEDKQPDASTTSVVPYSTPAQDYVTTDSPMSCAAIDVGAMYADPTSCYHYFMCQADLRLVRTQCHQSLHWNKFTKVCDYKTNVICDVPETTLPPNYESPTEFSCDYRLIGTYPDPRSCRHYYTCDAVGKSGYGDCGDTLYYNHAVYACDYPERVTGCPKTSEVVTTHSFVRIAEGLYDIVTSMITRTLLECLMTCAMKNQVFCGLVRNEGGPNTCLGLENFINGSLDCSSDLQCYTRVNDTNQSSPVW